MRVSFVYTHIKRHTYSPLCTFVTATADLNLKKHTRNVIHLLYITVHVQRKGCKHILRVLSLQFYSKYTRAQHNMFIIEHTVSTEKILCTQVVLTPIAPYAFCFIHFLYLSIHLHKDSSLHIFVRYF